MRHEKHTTRVIGPTGEVMTPVNLPPANVTRWVPRRKAEVVIAVHNGLLTMAEAQARYAISAEEFMAWERDYASEGLPGLRVSHRAASLPH